MLPLLLTKLTTAEISLWYLFASIIGLQSLVDAGFSPTFSRFVSYGMGGGKMCDLQSPKGKSSGEPDWETIASLKVTMHTVFSRLGFVWTFLLLTVGTASLIKPVAATGNQPIAWVCWGTILSVSTITVQGNTYVAYLQGINQVALLRRWEAITAFCGILTSFLVLILGGGLLGLVVANQGWQALSVVRNWWLVRSLDRCNRNLQCVQVKRFDRTVFLTAWPSAWRSGLGVLMTYGLVQASGILYAQVGEPASIATYLLALRLIQTISQFSQAPFYSKIPLLTRYFSEGRTGELLALAQRGMNRSHWVYVSSFILLGIGGSPLLTLIGSNATFPSPMLWSLLGIGLFFERYGAMHLQLYSVANKIIWHIANGGMGTIFIIVSLALFQLFGVYAFPVGMLAGYIGFYAWYCSWHSYSAYKLNFVSFERKALFAPSLLGLLGVILVFVTREAFKI